MKRGIPFLIPLTLTVVSACLGQTVSLEGRSCPCSSGWTCCSRANVCVQTGNACPNEAGVPPAEGGVPPATNTVLVGVLFPRSGVAGALTNGLTLDTSVSAWNTAALNAGAPQLQTVVCDESQLSTCLASFQSGGQEGKPQVILGPVSDKALIQVMSALPGTPIFSPLGDNAQFVTSPTGGVFCSPNRADMVGPFQSAIDLVARYAATLTGHGPQIKVALVQDSVEPDEADFVTRVSSGLQFNGEVPMQGTNYNEYDIASDVTQPGGQGIVQAEELGQFAPDVVALTGPVWADQFIYQVEGRVLASGAPRPLYLVFRSTDSLATFAGSAPRVTRRIFALDVDRDGPLKANLQTMSAWGGADSYIASGFNDCFFSMAYTMAAAAHETGLPPGSLSLMQVENGFAHIAGESSNEIDLTGEGVKVGLDEALSGTTSELRGTSVYLGADPTTGVPTLAKPSQPLGILCLGSAPGWEAAGVTYDQKGMPAGVDGGTIAIACP
jgi:hypothetical protein